MTDKKMQVPAVYVPPRVARRPRTQVVDEKATRRGYGKAGGGR